MLEILGTVILGAIGSLLAVYLIYQLEVGKRLYLRIFKLPFGLASTLAGGGIQRLTLSRADYHRYRSGTLREYLDTAKHKIDIVSVSLNVTQAEGNLISLFEQRINENENFRVRVTLLHPDSPVIPLLAKSLDLPASDLQNEIRHTLRQLVACKERLPPGASKRLHVCTHETLPIGSAILLDAELKSGRIQVETKLYRAPRTDSFGFEVAGPSRFYERNYTAWNRVFDDSTEWQAILALPDPIQGLIAPFEQPLRAPPIKPSS